MYGPNRGDQPNAVHAQLEARPPLTTWFELHLTEPSTGWSGTPMPPPLPAGPISVGAGGGDEHDSELLQVDFTAADLGRLRPGVIQYDVGTDDAAGYRSVRGDREQFRRAACAQP